MLPAERCAQERISRCNAFYLSLLKAGLVPTAAAYHCLEDLFKDLIRLTPAEGFVLLIDESDFPLSSSLNAPDVFEEIKDVLADFYTFLRNNSTCFNCDTVCHTEYPDCFGFTHAEIDVLLNQYNLEDKKDLLVKWYGGYRMGGRTEIFCPWDMLSYLSDVHKSSFSQPRLYWANTGSTAAIVSFIQQYYFELQDNIENLFAGKAVSAVYDENLSYNTLFNSPEHFWMLLYFTGYLTLAAGAAEEDNKLQLAFPNLEIKTIFASLVDQVNAEHYASADNRALYQAFFAGDADAISDRLSSLLFDTISYYDYREDFYHAFVAGLWSAHYKVESNRESGLGRPDILILKRDTRECVIIECKAAHTEKELAQKAQEALAQIEALEYAKPLQSHFRIIKAGLAFYQKFCFACCSSDS